MLTSGGATSAPNGPFHAKVLTASGFSANLHRTFSEHQHTHTICIPPPRSHAARPSLRPRAGRPAIDLRALHPFDAGPRRPARGQQPRPHALLRPTRNTSSPGSGQWRQRWTGKATRREEGWRYGIATHWTYQSRDGSIFTIAMEMRMELGCGLETRATKG